MATLTRTFADAGNVVVIGAALGARPGEATFVSDGTGSHIEAGSEGVAVTVDTVDSLFVDQGRRFTYLKADLEGWELDMLEGARRSLAEYWPRVSITTYHAPDHARLIADFLHEIDPRYTTTVRGIEDRWGAPVMLHAWIDEPEDAPEA